MHTALPRTQTSSPILMHHPHYLPHTSRYLCPYLCTGIIKRGNLDRSAADLNLPSRPGPQALLRHPTRLRQLAECGWAQAMLVVPPPPADPVQVDNIIYTYNIFLLLLLLSFSWFLAHCVQFSLGREKRKKERKKGKKKVSLPRSRSLTVQPGRLDGRFRGTVPTTSRGSCMSP
jgi:hypothetical protein